MIRDSLLYLLANLATRGAGFLMIPFYSAYLTPAEYGTIELIELVSQVVALAVGLNMFGGALIRIFQSASNPGEQRAVSSTALLSCAFLNLAGVGAGIAVAPLLGRVLLSSAVPGNLLQLMLLSLLFGNISELCLCYLRLQNRALWAVTYSISALVLTLGLNIYFIASLRLGVFGFVLSKLAVIGAGALLLATLTLRETGLFWDRPSAVAMLRFSAPLIFANASFFALHFADRFFLSRFSSLTDVGNYSLAYKFGFLVTFLVAEPFSRAWNVRYVAMTRAAGWQDTFRSASLLLLTALLSAGLAISLFSDEVLAYLVTAPYYPAFAAIPIVTAGYILREFGDFFRVMLYINKRSSLVSALSAGAAAVNFLLNWLLIPSSGMMGAAWATLLTWALYAVAFLFFASADLEIPFPRTAYATAFGVGAIWFVVGSWVGSFPWPLQFPLDGLLWGTFLLICWRILLPERERSLAAGKLRLGRDFLASRFAAIQQQ